VAADGIRGGAAYNERFAPAGGGDGTLAGYGVTSGAEFTRCKSCHAWDGLGNAGSYANRTGIGSGTATRPDVSDANLRAAAATNTPRELFDLVTSPWGRPMNAASDSRHPDYTGYLEDGQVWDLVKFMREEWVDSNELYDLAVSGAAMHYADVDGAWTLVKPTSTYSNIGKDGDAAAEV